MVDLLADSSTLLLFVVAALGFLLARVRIGGFSLGIAAVLFAGIAVGAVDDRLVLPEAVWVLGLVIFVYTVGLSSGPGFVSALRRRGLAANVVVLTAIAGAAGLVVAAWQFALTPATSTGVFAGALTNTPALAAALEQFKDDAPSAVPDAVVGYSLCYPLGVLVPLLVVYWLLRGVHVSRAPLKVTTVRVERAAGPLASVARNVTFSRLQRDGELLVPAPQVEPRPGDLLTVVGTEDDVAATIAFLGSESEEHLELDRRTLDMRRMVVSDRRVAGRTLADLDLSHRFGATVTRVRRGDVDMLADPQMTVELGDRLRVVAPREQLPEVARFLGDSIRSLAEIDILTFSVGIAAGLLIGSIPIPYPGGSFELGFAGGPLLVSLVLGARGRTGPLLWQLPHNANLTLRQLGMVLFLAGVGTRSGQSFADTIVTGDALEVIGVGAAVSAFVALGVLVVGLRLLRLPRETLAGVIAGAHTQPAVLGFASERSGDEAGVSLGYATVYPLAIIVKILAAQVLAGLAL